MSTSQVALYSLVGERDHTLLRDTQRVLRYCDSLASWRNLVLFTVLPALDEIKVDGLSVIQIPYHGLRNNWEIFVGRTLPEMLKEFDFSIAIHADGFILDVNLWDEKFLNYDYCAAPWETGVVGSGGCALTSARFNRAVSGLPWYNGEQNADEWYCLVDNRKTLEKQNIRFAPPELASKYCTETTDVDVPSFCYHGQRHAVSKHKQAWDNLVSWERANGFA